MKNASHPRLKLGRLLPLCLTFCLIACSSAGVTPPVVSIKTVDSTCKVFKRMTWSVKDTTETASQVRAFNAKYGRLCRAKSA